MDHLKFALTQIRLLAEDGLDVAALTKALADDAFASGPTIAQVVDRIAPRSANDATLRTYSTHFRRLTRGFAVRVDDYATLVDVAEEFGVALPSTFGADQVVDDWNRDLKRRTWPMVIFEPADPDLRLSAITLTQIERWALMTKICAVTRRRVEDAARQAQGRPSGPKSQNGATSVRALCSALNRIFDVAIGDGLVPPSIVNPVSRFRRPAKSPQPKPMLSAAQILELWEVVNLDDYDPELCSLLVEFHLNVGAREEGAINLNLDDLDHVNQLIYLHEKGDVRLPIPASQALMAKLVEFASSRGSEAAADPVFRQKRRVAVAQGQLVHPRITRRTYNRLHRIVQDALPWAAQIEFGSHWLRGHAAALVAAQSTPEVKRAFLRHKPADQADRYGQASLEQLAAACARAFYFEHPLVVAPNGSSG